MRCLPRSSREKSCSTPSLGQICALNRSKKFPKLAESQCPPAYNIGSPSCYTVEITIAKCRVKKRGVLAKPVVTETDAAKVPAFVFGHFALYMQVETPFQIVDLVCCFLLEVGNFRKSYVALRSSRICGLLKDFNEAGLLVWSIPRILACLTRRYLLNGRCYYAISIRSSLQGSTSASQPRPVATALLLQKNPQLSHSPSH
jgi:hypothetical protein